MHGRPRQPKGLPVDPEKAKAKEKKLLQFRQLTNSVLERARAKQYDQESLVQAALLLQKNPDVSTIWNYRRLALADVLEGSEGADRAKQAAGTELNVIEAALHENPKSYSAWYHCLWIIRKGLISLDEVLKQISRLLQMDSRNFHAWRCRREVMKFSGTAPEDELEYTRSLIDSNFSNYSAWHARTALLNSMCAAEQVVSLQDLIAGNDGDTSSQPAVSRAVLGPEYDLVQQAFFTDPEDQSAYMYHRWLLKTSMSHLHSAQHTEEEEARRKELVAVLLREESRCRELLAIEPDRSRCKWPMLTVAHILDLQTSIGMPASSGEMRSLYADLSDIDPLRRGYYSDAASKLAQADAA